MKNLLFYFSQISFMKSKKIVSIGLMLIGLIFIIQAVGLSYVLVKMGKAMGSMSGLDLLAVGGIEQQFKGIMTMSWGYTILQLITGIVAVVGGIASLVEKE